MYKRQILSGSVRGAGDSLIPMIMTSIGVCVTRILWVLTVEMCIRDSLKTLPEDLKFITEDGKGVQSGNVMAKAFAIAAQRGLSLIHI